MRKSCKQRNKAKRILLVACAGACAALILYCVPKWIFLVVAAASLMLAGWRLLSN